MLTANTVSTEHSGNKTFKASGHRKYFFIVMTEGAGTITFGGGTGKIPLKLNEHYAPPIAPSGTIEVETTGKYVVHSDQQEV